MGPSMSELAFPMQNKGAEYEVVLTLHLVPMPAHIYIHKFIAYHVPVTL